MTAEEKRRRGKMKDVFKKSVGNNGSGHSILKRQRTFIESVYQSITKLILPLKIKPLIID